MMKAFILIAILLINGCLRFPKEAKTHGSEPPEVWLEIHDVSPGWKYWRLEQLINITEKHRDAFSKAVLFVIPNHAGATPLNSYPEYVRQLKLLETKGYVLGLHGYAHPTPPIYEMNVSQAVAIQLINASLEEFQKANLTEPRYFAPPGWVVSPEAERYLNSAFDYVYYAQAMKTPQGIRNYTSHEYTWYTSNATSSMQNATREFLQTNGVFRLTIHLEAGNTPQGLMFIDEFLAWIENQKK